MAGKPPAAKQSRLQADSGVEADVSQRCWLPDGEATWICNIQALEIALPLVIRF